MAGRLSRCSCALAALTAWMGAAPSLAAPQAFELVEPPPEHYSAARLVRGFGFDDGDPELFRGEVPRQFQRYVEPTAGFPPFGRIGLDDAAAAEGTDWSLRFDIAQASLSARTRAGLLPVQPLADHRVSVRVRTEDLVHAGARLSAWLVDAESNEIPGSRADSAVLRTGGTWETLELLVRGEAADAVGLVVDLQVLEPSRNGKRAADELLPDPVLLDDRGAAWFDEVRIWQVARIELATESATNVLVPEDDPRLRILVRDLTDVPLEARLRVRDLDGRIVHDVRFPAPHGRHPAWMPLPIDRRGWYEAIAEVSEDGKVVGRAVLPFVLRGPDIASARSPSHVIGVQVDDVRTRRLAELPELVRHLGAGSVTIEASATDLERDAIPVHLETIRRMVDALLAREIEVSFMIGQVPAWASRLVGVDRNDVSGFVGIPGLLARSGPFGMAPQANASTEEQADFTRRVRSDSFVVYLHDLLVHFGLSAQAWQLGADPHGRADAALAQRVAAARTEIGRLVPEPSLRIPVRAIDELPPPESLPTVAITVPWRIRPDAIPEYLSASLPGTRDVQLHLEPLPRAQYSARQQTVDLAFRALEAWRAGASRLSIAAPWRDGEHTVVPEPAFAVWRGLADILRARTYEGVLPLAEGVQCWMLRGDRPEDDALLIWRDERPGAPPTLVNLLLGPGPAVHVDLHGNETRLPIVGNRHAIPVTDQPALITAIDLNLARFRAALRIDPPFVPATHRLHEHELVLDNPWSIGLTGTLRLGDLPGARLSPHAFRFTIAPDEELRLPLEIVFERGIAAGRKQIDADLEIETIEKYNLSVSTELEVGWKDAEMRSDWRAVRNRVTGQLDLFVRVHVTNRSDRPLSLDVFLLAEGVPTMQRIISGLEPGTGVQKTFPIRDGARLLAGRRIRVGVADHEGLAQLNHLLEIPATEERVVNADE